jgi:hypothetical protein
MVRVLLGGEASKRMRQRAYRGSDMSDNFGGVSHGRSGRRGQGPRRRNGCLIPTGIRPRGVCEKPLPPRSRRVGRVHPEPQHGHPSGGVLALNQRHLVFRHEHELEMGVPVIGAGVEQRDLKFLVGDPHDLSRRLRQVAPKAGQGEVVEHVWTAPRPGGDVLDMELLAREFVRREAVFAPVLRSFRNLRVKTMSRSIAHHGAAQPPHARPRSHHRPGRW